MLPLSHNTHFNQPSLVYKQRPSRQNLNKYASRNLFLDGRSLGFETNSSPWQLISIGLQYKHYMCVSIQETKDQFFVQRYVQLASIYGDACRFPRGTVRRSFRKRMVGTKELSGQVLALKDWMHPDVRECRAQGHSFI